MRRVDPSVTEALMHAMAAGDGNHVVSMVDPCTECGAEVHAYALYNEERSAVVDEVLRRAFDVRTLCDSGHDEETDGRFTIRG